VSASIIRFSPFLLQQTMQQERSTMPRISPKISEQISRIAEPPMQIADDMSEVRDYLGQGINARQHLGRTRAVHQVAREVHLTPRRVMAILRGEVQRLWHDEWQAIQTWYVEHCDREARRLEHEASQLRARRAAIEGRIGCG
jgi:hypothetical protein